jgi:hypothetical protein
MPLTPTPGAADANTYCTLAEANLQRFAAVYDVVVGCW